MGTIEIKVSDYYDKPKFYAYMPEEIFNALEAAFISGETMAVVSKFAFELMLKTAKNETKKEDPESPN